MEEKPPPMKYVSGRGKDAKNRKGKGFDIENLGDS